MSEATLILVIVVATALIFDYTNGFHDAANAIATAVSTRALRPRVAVLLAAVLNFVGAFISLEVAATVANDVVNPDVITQHLIFGGLVGAITWNMIAWWFGLPISVSHSLIGGMVGAAFAAVGSEGIFVEGVFGKVLIPALIAPIVAFIVAAVGIVVAYRIIGRQRPGVVARAYRYGQVASASLFALAHGSNDAQKTMGVITLALIAHGTLPAGDFEVPLWVIASAATAIGLGTYTGGWRIIRTMGTRVHDMDSAQGFTAEGAGSAVVLASTYFGFPLSTTHVISGAIMGSGAGKRVSAVRWGVAGNIFAAWLLTMPVAAVFGAVAYGVVQIFGPGAVGPIVVVIAGLAVAGFFLRRRVVRGVPVPSH